MLWGGAIGLGLKELRCVLGYSQEDLANLLGVSWITVQRWEVEERFPQGLPNKFLHLLSDVGAAPWFAAVLLDARARDPMWVLFKLLEHTYATTAPPPPAEGRA